MHMKHVTTRYSDKLVGIIAGVWSCGKITLIGELFGNESLSQVYGFLHTFLFENQASLVNMSKFTYYLLPYVHYW